MTPTDFPERNLIIAEHQPEYIPIPAHVSRDGTATFCWELSDEELEILKNNYSFNKQVEAGFLVVENKKLNVEKVVDKKMEKKDRSASLSSKDFPHMTETIEENGEGGRQIVLTKEIK